ncbi:uncharacterized protein LOC100186988 [Ciona intestinalis]
MGMFVVLALFLTVVYAQSPHIRWFDAFRAYSTEMEIEGYCKRTLDMIFRGVEAPIQTGSIVNMDICQYCVCTGNGSFRCCLNITNAGRNYFKPEAGGRTCIRCSCASIETEITDHQRQRAIQHNQTPDSNCYRFGLKLCVGSLCMHPVLQKPACIAAQIGPGGCCDICTTEGCFLQWHENENTFRQVGHFKGFQNFSGKIISLELGMSIRKGCVAVHCQKAPDGLASQLRLENTCN